MTDYPQPTHTGAQIGRALRHIEEGRGTPEEHEIAGLHFARRAKRNADFLAKLPSGAGSYSHPNAHCGACRSGTCRSVVCAEYRGIAECGGRL